MSTTRPTGSLHGSHRIPNLSCDPQGLSHVTRIVMEYTRQKPLQLQGLFISLTTSLLA
ncbi:hypothetical protein [Prochlorococcus marinus]|uniref:hypothetical protein n=1 Tax=Prochlorococcus marinus TaxID=1219 RepID=UPI001F3361E9|nr:hypothetical protein [Prochlorococcus marinus]